MITQTIAAWHPPCTGAGMPPWRAWMGMLGLGLATSSACSLAIDPDSLRRGASADRSDQPRSTAHAGDAAARHDGAFGGEVEDAAATGADGDGGPPVEPPEEAGGAPADAPGGAACLTSLGEVTCTGTQNCEYARSTQTWSCGPSGAVQKWYGPCTSQSDCVKGTACVDNNGDLSFYCKPFCHLDADCAPYESVAECTDLLYDGDRRLRGVFVCTDPAPAHLL